MRLLRRTFIGPVTRTAILTWSWNHRHELLRWLRSLWNELTSTAPFSLPRLRRLVRVLWSTATDPELRDARELRSVRIVGDEVELDLDPTWVPATRAIARLEALEGVGRVRVRPIAA